MMTCHVHIDHVVLDGLPVQPSQLPALRSALESALTALLTADCPTSAATRGGVYARMPAPAASPTALGGQIAAAVHREVTS